jgi:hypothetical protein
VDNQAYVVFKVVKHFRPYLLKSHTRVIVPYPMVRNIFIQKEFGEVRNHWMTILQEYDLEIKQEKIVCGQGLCQMAPEAVADDGWENEATKHQVESVKVVDAPESWYSDLRYYLSTCDIPAGLDARKRRELCLKSARYHLVSRILFRKKIDNVMLRFFDVDFMTIYAVLQYSLSTEA